MQSSNDAFSFGFRIVGSTVNDRRLISWPAAFNGYADCDQRAEVDKEAYLSAFRFGQAFKEHLAATGSTRGYAGPTWADWLWFDIDCHDIANATREARRLAAGLVGRFKLEDGDLLLFFSGSKGYHIGLPLSVCGNLEPSVIFHRVCRRFAEAAAARASVSIDAGVYDKVRAFRAPNSRHQKTGLHKRNFAFDELMGLSVNRIVELAGTPESFEPPEPPAVSDQAASDWADAASVVTAEVHSAESRRSSSAPGDSRLNRSTLDFIRDGAIQGGATDDRERGAGRHRLLFSAAANLAEFGCSLSLAEALLTDAALDSGLSPSDVRRQIKCGIGYKSQG